MGRVDTNGSQYHQGLQFEDLHQPQNHQTPTTDTNNINSHPQEDLYEPPLEYVEPSSEPQTQQFPPKHEEDEGTQVFPPPYDHQETGQPQANYNFNFHQQQQPKIDVGFNNNIPQQQNVFAHQPVGGIPFSGNGMPSSSPAPLTVNQQLPNQAWKTDLFDCCQDPTNAIITLCFPCITFGQIAEILDSGSTSCGTSGMLYGLIQCCLGIPCIISCSYRSKMRSRFGLIESPCADCLVHCCCEYCALCQEYRELKERGFDPSIGYLGNMARQQQQQQQFGTTPPMQQRMI